MHRGYVRLWRKILNNEFLKWDKNAYIVFTRLFLLVDRKTGQWNGGRILLGGLTGLKPTTAYNASRRLEKAKMVTLSGNNKFTTFSICNWKKYQSVDDSVDDNQMTTSRQPDDTIPIRTRSKNKEVRISTNLAKSISALLGVELGSIHDTINELDGNVDLLATAREVSAWLKKYGYNNSWSEGRIKQKYIAWCNAKLKQTTNLELMNYRMPEIYKKEIGKK